MENVITMREAVQWIDSGKPFSCVVCTLNVKLKTGGEWLTILEAKKHNVRSRQPTEREARLQSFSGKSKFVRNIVLLQQGQETENLKTIHPSLLKTFNNKEVVL